MVIYCMALIYYYIINILRASFPVLPAPAFLHSCEIKAGAGRTGNEAVALPTTNLFPLHYCNPLKPLLFLEIVATLCAFHFISHVA